MNIKAQFEKGVYFKDIAMELGVHPRTVRRAIKRGGSPSRSSSVPSMSRSNGWNASNPRSLSSPPRGVQHTVAITVVAELGDLTRFDNPRQLAAFVGLIPSEHTSGTKRSQGPITKAGNARARRALIEGAWAYRYPAKISPHIQKRNERLPKIVQDIGWKAQVRLGKRFRRLVSRGKHTNVAVTAIARELIAFMWAIARVVPIEA